MKKIGFIDHYLDEYHAENYPKWIKDASNGEMQVCYAWAEVDSPAGKSNRQCCDEWGIELLSSIEEVVEKSDYLVVLSPDHPDRHEDLCALPLASGKPTYVDKTFATSREGALNIIHMARAGNTPFFSTSALRFANEYVNLNSKGIEAISSRGPGGFDQYAIHQLEPIICLMGAQVEKIMYIGAPSTPAFILKFSGGRYATMTQLGWECDFSLGINYQDDKAVVLQGASDFYLQFIQKLVVFFSTGIPPVEAEETLQIMTILDYGRRAMQNADIWIELPEAALS